MKKHIPACAAVLAILAVMTISGAAGTAEAGEEARRVYIYTWSDYFDSGVLREFEEANNCLLEVDYFDSNESMYAKLKAGGGGYDIITPSSYMSAVMRKQDMLMTLDHALLPNLGNMDRNFTRHTEDPGMAYSVPYTRTVTGIGYNAGRVKKEDLGSWDIFGKNAYAKRMTMLNDMREAIGAALKYLGHSINSTDEGELAEAGKVLMRWKRNLAKFDVDEAKIGLAGGEFLAVQGYNGDVALIMEESPDVGFYIPKEGSSLASDDFVIAADSPHADLAHAFINYMLEPGVARTNMESIRYYMPNPEAVKLLDPELRDNPAFNVGRDVMDKCEVIRDLGPDNAKYARVWDAVKADE
ncbi:MAG: spermidine/putrescine ABC transporter substrate-binding protein [Planctomycetota bacterium]|jgi:spermidine/putrescine transport system substrate-binding protein|nr:spermidine/putrescine ABC transporter substrate-binding protein [Planctomycetota bacterium]